MQVKAYIIGGVQRKATGATIHDIPQVIGFYRMAVSEYNRTGDENWRKIAEQIETSLERFTKTGKKEDLGMRCG